MSKFNKESFLNFIVDNNIVGFFENPITLKSGRVSSWYANWRNITEDVFLTDQLTDFIINFVEDNLEKPDCFYGIPEGATKTAVITQFKWAKLNNYQKGSHILSMGRAKPKEHGAPQDRFFVGAPQGKVIVIEDVTTTGGSLITNLENLKAQNIEIVCALALFNRMEKRDDGQSVEEKVNSMGIKYMCMSHALEVLPQLIEKMNISEKMVSDLKEYFVKYGIRELC